jgi:hypothetical protein
MKDDEEVYLDNFKNTLHSIYLKYGNNYRGEKDKEDAITLQLVAQFLRKYVKNIEQHTYRNTDFNCYYLFVVPVEWEDAMKEEIIRPLFIAAGLINANDHDCRLLFLNRLECISEWFQDLYNMGVRRHSGYDKLVKGQQYLSCTLRLTAAKNISINWDMFELKARFTETVGSRLTTTPRVSKSMFLEIDPMGIVRKKLAELLKRWGLSEEYLNQDSGMGGKSIMDGGQSVMDVILPGIFEDMQKVNKAASASEDILIISENMGNSFIYSNVIFLQCYYAVYEKSDIHNNAFNRYFSNGTNQRRKNQRRMLLEKLGLTTAQIQEVELLISEETCNAVIAPLEEKLKNCLNDLFSQKERQKPAILIPWIEGFDDRPKARGMESSYLNWIEKMVKKFGTNFNYRFFQFDTSHPDCSYFFKDEEKRDCFARIEIQLIFYGIHVYRLARIAMSDKIIPPHVILNDDVNGDRELGQFLNAECPSIIITTGR